MTDRELPPFHAESGAAASKGNCPDSSGALPPEGQAYPWLRHYPPGIDWHMAIPVKPLHLLFEETAAQFPDNFYLDFMGRRSTYKQVAKLVDKAAAGFQKLGAGPGTKIGLCLPNTPYYIINYFAALKIGATAVNYNPLYTQQELTHQMADSDTNIMVTMDLAITLPKVRAAAALVPSTTKIVACPMAGCLPFAKQILFRLFKRKDVVALPKDDPSVIGFDALIANSGNPAAVQIDPLNDIAVLQYTGGTTGVPKGAMLTHANLYTNAIQSATWVREAEPGKERFVAVLPFFHVFAMTAIMNVGTRWGAELLLLPKFEVKPLMQLIRKRKATLLAAVPGIVNALNEHASVKRYNMRSLKFCVSGGAPMPQAVADKFLALTGCRTIEGYGLTECSPVASFNPTDPALQRSGTIGLPFPRTVIEIVDPADKVTLMPAGEKGELAISGPQVMKGYWKHPAETAATLRNGRLLTGDIGTMDEDGYIRIVDRIKDMIINNGMKIYPREVEEVIYSHPGVAECVVAGVPDPRRGEIVMAWIKTREGKGVPDITDYLKARLASYKIPRRIEMRDSLPKTLIGKPDRKALVAEAAARLAASGGDTPLVAASPQSEPAKQ